MGLFQCFKLDCTGRAPRELGGDVSPAAIAELLCRRPQGQRFCGFGASSLRTFAAPSVRRGPRGADVSSCHCGNASFTLSLGRFSFLVVRGSAVSVYVFTVFAFPLWIDPFISKATNEK